MKITKRQLRRIIREGLTQSQRATAAYASQHRSQRGQTPLDSGDDDAAAEKDAFLDSMAEMWHDHFTAAAPFSAVIRVLNSAYQDLDEEYR